MAVRAVKGVQPEMVGDPEGYTAEQLDIAQGMMGRAPIDYPDLAPEQIEELKEQLRSLGRSDKVYALVLNDKQYVFAGLTGRDHKEIMNFLKKMSKPSNEDYFQRVCETGLLYPPIANQPLIWDTEPAGLPTTLASAILGRSGFVSQTEDQSDYLFVEDVGEPAATVEPEPEVLEALQREHGSVRKVFVVDGWYVIRPINRLEWKTLMKKFPQREDFEEEVAAHCVVWSRSHPEKPQFASALAGVADTLFDEISEISGNPRAAKVVAL